MLEFRNQIKSWAIVNGFREPNWLEAVNYSPSCSHTYLYVKNVNKYIYKLYDNPYLNIVVLEVNHSNWVWARNIRLECLEYSTFGVKVLLGYLLGSLIKDICSKKIRL